MQCFAYIEEIKLVTKSLLNRYLHSTPIAIFPNAKNNQTATFKIDFKRRNCSHLTRNKVIDAVTPMVLSEMTDTDEHDVDEGKDKLDRKDDGMRQKIAVNLTDPDFSIRIETCKTLCGISVLPRETWYKKFNLAELRETSSES